MKRALAERAKQSGLPLGGGGSLSSADDVGRAALGPGSDSVQQPPDQPLLKIPRLDTPRSILSSSTTPTTMNPAAASPRSLVTSAGSSKRQRDSLTIATGPSGGDVDEDDSNFSAFYLRHQNRALASELSSLKYQLSHLKRERDYRRTQCRKACQSLNSLQATWTQMEAALQLGQQPPPHHHLAAATAPGEWAHRNRTNEGEDDASTCPPAGPPLSTGLGKSAELIDALLDALAALGNSPPPPSREGKSRRRRRGHGDEDDEDHDMDDSSVDSSESYSSESFHESNSPIDNVEQQHLDDLLGISDNVTQRADTLQRWIWSLLELLEKQGSSGNAENGAASFSFPTDPSRILPINKISSQLAREEAKTKRLKAQLKEVARARDEMQSSDKRVRRGLYRLAAGRMPLTEVLKAIESSDEDKEAAVAWMEAGTTGGGQGGLGSPPGHMLSSRSATTMAPLSVGSSTSFMPYSELSGSMNPEPVMDAPQISQMQRRLAEFEQVAASREEQIQKLLQEREDQMKRINGLILTRETTGASTETSDEEVQRSDLYAQVKAKLTSTERNLQEQRDILNRVKEEWSSALGDADLARTTMEELESKHAKKWSELTVNGFEDDGLATSLKGSSEEKTFLASKDEAEQIVTLRHKLTQALENVRQAETTRHTLSEAILMNDSLQSKLEELKGKYAALQAGRAGSAHVSSSSNSNTTAATPKLKSSSTSSSSNLTQSAEKVEKNNEKLLRDYKRMRKDLAMVTASKEAAKAKLERNEKERDSLIQTNSRLLKQTAEKDEMNAKSLSTILHLKQLTEQISKEKASMNQQAKSAHQLALAARLASNARDRVAEEFLKDRQALEKCAGEWEQKFSSIANEKELMNEKMVQQKAKMSALLRDFTKAKARCDELVTESTKLTEDKKNVLEKLAVTQREALEVASRLDSMARQRPTSGGGGNSDNNSDFTVDQLNTQVSVLKGRLACPVCNHRDKKCILLRCRHMFCKVCVDENIKNRSRKCPACGQRFDTKDVADVWL